MYGYADSHKKLQSQICTNRISYQPYNFELSNWMGEVKVRDVSYLQVGNLCYRTATAHHIHLCREGF